jgi:hypothetical protein
MHTPTNLVNGVVAPDVSPVALSEVTEGPTTAGRVVFIDGCLCIDGRPVCPLCHEDRGSEFCACTSADLIVDLDAASLRNLRAVS